MAKGTARRRIGTVDLAARLNVSPRTISTMIRDGRLPPPHYLAGSGRRLWWEEEVEAWERTRIGTSGPGFPRPRKKEPHRE